MMEFVQERLQLAGPVCFLLIDTKNKLVVVGGVEYVKMGKISEGDEEIQTSGYKINKS